MFFKFLLIWHDIKNAYVVFEKKNGYYVIVL